MASSCGRCMDGERPIRISLDTFHFPAPSISLHHLHSFIHSCKINFVWGASNILVWLSVEYISTSNSLTNCVKCQTLNGVNNVSFPRDNFPFFDNARMHNLEENKISSIFFFRNIVVVFDHFFCNVNKCKQFGDEQHYDDLVNWHLIWHVFCWWLLLKTWQVSNSKEQFYGRPLVARPTMLKQLEQLFQSICCLRIKGWWNKCHWSGHCWSKCLTCHALADLDGVLDWLWWIPVIINLIVNVICSFIFLLPTPCPHPLSLSNMLTFDPPCLFLLKSMSDQVFNTMRKDKIGPD